jgi:hypothetical protein
VPAYEAAAFGVLEEENPIERKKILKISVLGACYGKA